jgi:hypothetical protein
MYSTLVTASLRVNRSPVSSQACYFCVRKNICVCCEHNTQHVTIERDLNAEQFSVTTGGVFSYQ